MRNRLSALGSRRLGGGAEAGLSLVEATVILGVVSLLTAVLAPNIRAYVNTAQQAAAKRDVETIGAALSKMLIDLGEAWVLRDGTAAVASTTHTTPSHATSNRVDLLVSDGRIPNVNTVRSSGSPDWDAAVCSCPGTPTGVQKLEWFLVLNTPSSDAAKKFREPADLVAGNFDPDAGGQYNAEYAWRGAYLPGPIGPDPWGNRYAVNVEYLARIAGAGPSSGNVNDVVVISAGNNSLIETRFDTDGVSNGNDVIYLVSGGTR